MKTYPPPPPGSPAADWPMSFADKPPSPTPRKRVSEFWGGSAASGGNRWDGGTAVSPGALGKRASRRAKRRDGRRGESLRRSANHLVRASEHWGIVLRGLENLSAVHLSPSPVRREDDPPFDFPRQQDTVTVDHELCSRGTVAGEAQRVTDRSAQPQSHLALPAFRDL